MKTKWAQMSKLERAWEKLQGSKTYACELKFPSTIDIIKFACERRPKKRQSKYNIREQRERNRYHQLVNHWCKLKKEVEAIAANS